jgi:hypothetical protein
MRGNKRILQNNFNEKLFFVIFDAIAGGLFDAELPLAVMAVYPLVKTGKTLVDNIVRSAGTADICPNVK